MSLLVHEPARDEPDDWMLGESPAATEQPTGRMTEYASRGIDSVSSQGSITRWIHEVKQGNHSAASELWDRYVCQLANVARFRLTKTSRQVIDEEDLVVSVFDRFVRAAEAGKFAELSDRSSFWRLLVRMTKRKLIDRHRYESRQRRTNNSQRVHDLDWNQIADKAPDPSLAADMADDLSRLLNGLSDQRLQELTLGKLEGYTNEEMAERMSVSVRTIERLLARIRKELEPKLTLHHTEARKPTPGSQRDR